MKIVVAQPPNFEKILPVFPMASNVGVIFTYGDTIYNPSDVEIPRELMAHESVHSQRHGDDPAGWWERYLADPIFRLEEEMLAHRAEYRAFKSWTKDRNQVAAALTRIAARISGPLYGSMISNQHARRLILVEVYANKGAKIRREERAAQHGR